LAREPALRLLVDVFARSPASIQSGYLLSDQIEYGQFSGSAPFSTTTIQAEAHGGLYDEHTNFFIMSFAFRAKISTNSL
jgi:hypothetical protein